MKVNVKILNQGFFNEFPLPTYATPESAGLDLRSTLPMIIESGQRVLVPTGLAIDFDDPTAMLVLVPKSGLGHKKGLVLGNLVGIIDSDYHQEVGISLWNTSKEWLEIARGQAICQAIMVPILRVEWNVVTDFQRTVERSGGWGSTG